MKRLLINLFISLSLIFLIGCGVSGKLKKEGEAGEKVTTRGGVINESYEPPAMAEDELKIKQTISVDSQSDNIDEILNNQVEKITPEEVSGFRVQICAVSDENQAKSIQKDAIFAFINEEVYLKYDSPYYKVRVGNCTTRYEAEQLQKRAVEKGFPDAWVVRTKVKAIEKSEDIQPTTTDEPPN